MLPLVSNDSSTVDGSRETVAAIARKAEAKARAASAARAKASTTGSGVLGGMFGGGDAAHGAGVDELAGGGPSGDDTSAMPVFGEEAPIPTAAEL